MRPKQWRACSENGCPELVQGRTRCEAHTREANAYRPNSTQRGYDARWRKASKQYLQQHPVCAVIGCNKPSTDTDHIDGLGPLGPRGYDTTNWLPLCHSHHSTKTAHSTAAQRQTRQ